MLVAISIVALGVGVGGMERVAVGAGRVQATRANRQRIVTRRCWLFIRVLSERQVNGCNRQNPGKDHS